MTSSGHLLSLFAASCLSSKLDILTNIELDFSGVRIVAWGDGGRWLGAVDAVQVELRQGVDRVMSGWGLLGHHHNAVDLLQIRQMEKGVRINGGGSSNKCSTIGCFPSSGLSQARGHCRTAAL